MWGVRSGERRGADRRSGFSMMERELDRQFDELKTRVQRATEARRASEATWAPTDAFPDNIQPGSKPG